MEERRPVSQSFALALREKIEISLILLRDCPERTSTVREEAGFV